VQQTASVLVPKRLVAAFAFGVLIGSLILAINLRSAEVPPPGSDATGYVVQTSPPHEAIEVILNQGDGQSALAIGQDPGLSDPDAFLEGAPAAAFFAQRPLLGYLAWAGSLGQHQLTAWSVAAITILSAGTLAAVAMGFAQARGAGPADVWAVAVLLLPGALTVLDWTGPDLLGLTLAIAGLWCWLPRRPHRWLGATAFVLAGLSRESLLLVPVVLAVWLLWSRRLQLRDAISLAAAPAAYLLWMAIVRLRLGTGPEQVARASSFSLPFVDLVGNIGGFTATEWAVAALGLGLVAAAVIRSPRDVCTWSAVAYLVGATVLNAWLWESWQGFSRVLLPMYAFAVLALLPRSDPRRQESSPEGVSAGR
jgi:hypothetical protein